MYVFEVFPVLVFCPPDILVWQEMLVGYFLGHLSAKEMLDWVNKAASPLSTTTESRSEYLTEFHFYHAQLQSVRGDRDSRQRKIDSLHQAVEAGGALMTEYIMALYQLRAEGLH